MTTLLTPPQPAAPAAPQPAAPTPPPRPTGPRPYRFSVAQYQRMTAAGILTANDRVELLEGEVVEKMPRNPPHDGTTQLVDKRICRRLPPGWDTRCQLTLQLGDSQPEPDVAVVRGDETTYLQRHPTAADAALVIEVADSTLLTDRRDKARLYARAGVPAYWIVNLVDRRVEVFTDPSGPALAPAYATLRAYAPGEAIPLLLAATPGTAVPAAELLP